MSVNAKFVADFESFHSAVQKAEVELRSFESGAAKVGGALNRMTDSFSGRKIVQEATLMAEVFKRAGGAATFTTAELARMGTVGAEAMEKLTRTGAPVPQQLKAMADATKGVGQQTSLLTMGIGALAGAFTLAKVASFATDLVSAAGALQDMHERTDISVAGLQRFKVIAEQSGSSLDAVATAVFQMGRRMAGDDKSAAKAVAELGLNFAAIRAMRPEDAFNTVGKALAALDDPMKRAQLGTAIFGRSVDDLIPTLKHLTDETGAYVTATATQIKAIDALGDAWVRSKASLVPVTVALIDNTFQLSRSYTFWSTLLGKIDEAPKVMGAAKAALDAMNTGVAGRALQPMGGADLDRTAKEAIQELNEALAAKKQAMEKAKAATDKVIAVQKAFTDSVTTATETLHLSVFAVNRFNVVLPMATSRSQEFTEALRDWIPVLESATGGLDGVTGSVEELGRSGQHTAAVLVGMGDEALMGVLVPAIKGSGEAIHAVDTEVNTFGDSLNSVQHDLRAFPDLLVKAFTGGGGVSGAMKALGVQIADDLLGPLAKKAGDVIGSLTKSIGGKIAGGLGMGSAVGSAAGLAGTVALGAATMGISVAASLAIAGLQKLWSMRGPSKEERAARGETGEMQKTIADMATAAQQVEAATAGWSGALDLIVVRDAYGKLGKSAEEARRDIAAVWNDKDQAGHAAALGRINDALAQQADLATATGDAAAAASQVAGTAAAAQAAAFQRDLDALISQRDSLLEKISGEAPEDVMGVIEAQTRGQIGALDREIDKQRQKMAVEAEEMAAEVERAFKELKITIPIAWDIPDLPGGRVTMPSSGEARFVPFQRGGSSAPASAGVQTIITKTYLDTRQIAEALTRGRW